MKKNVVFYLGAGASANCLPVVKDMSNALKAAKDYLNNKRVKPSFDPNLFKTKNIDIDSAYDRMIETWEWLAQKCDGERSIDLFAQIIRHDNAKYKKLKAGLICFFDFIQHQKLPDYRYEKFIGVLINACNKSLCSNIKIISWNYDIQMEYAYAKHTGMHDPYDVQTRLNSLPSDWSMDWHNHTISDKKFALIKLNGSAALYQENRVVKEDPDIITSDLITNGDYDKDTNLKEQININYLRKLIIAYDDLCNNKRTPYLKFAWDNNNQMIGANGFVNDLVKDASLLVIIGYSFPDYNRAIDENILGAMNKLEKIYLQVHEKGVEEAVLSNLEKVNPSIKGKVLVKVNPHEFYIPHGVI